MIPTAPPGFGIADGGYHAAGMRDYRTVVVTGASAGVGRATFARRGADVALLARHPDRLGRAAEEVRVEGGRGLAIPTDVADPAQVRRRRPG